MARILVVDDDAGTCEAIHGLLKTVGSHSVKTAASFDKARTILLESATPFELVISDFNLGKNQPTGLDVLRFIRDSGQTLPVILVTGENHLGSLWKGWGFSGFIKKIRLLDDLDRTVNALLKEAEQ